MEQDYLVVYDIADTRRMQKVASELLNYGVRVQKSVFEVRLHAESLRYLKNNLQACIDPEKDGIKIFRLCEACTARRSSLGKVTHLQPTPSWIIV